MKASAPNKSQVVETRLKCLLVDDLDYNLMVLSALLAQDGVELLKASSGREALELLLIHEFALAILDVQMPEMDGFELAELMRSSERTRRVPIIFVTAGVRDQQWTFKGYEIGAVDFLYKPIDGSLLRSKADVFFELYRQRRQLACELHEKSETLRLNEMFMAVLGHDLRTPLNAITASAAVLKRQCTDELAQQAAARVLSSSQRMGRMIEDVLDLARARLAGGISIRRLYLDFGQLVDRVVQEHQVATAGPEVRVHRSGDLTGDWDADRLFQALSNLLGNALEHGTANGLIQVLVDGSHPQYVQLSISNDGEIPADILPQLFDPFRAATEHGRTRGLGLGLYIVQQIAIAHGGAINVDAGTPGQVLFELTLPRSAKTSH